MPVQKPFWDYFWIAKYLFRATGIFSFGGPLPLWKSILNGFIVVLQLTCCFYVQIEPMNYILFQNYDLDDLLDAAIIILAMIATQVRILFMIANHHKFERLFDYCMKLWDDASPADYLVIFTRAKQELSLPENSTTRFYPYGFGDDVTPSPQFEIKCGLQVLSVHVALVALTAADSAGILVSLSLCGQLDLIQTWLHNIKAKEPNSVGKETDEQVKVGLEKCIRRHQEVMNFCNELDDSFRYINLSQILVGLYIFAISGARLLKNIKSYRNIGSLITPIIGFFFSCWPADELLSASSKVTVAIYDLPWHVFGPQQRISVAIMLARSQRPPKLTAGKFVTLSLETFSSILYNGFSICMVLNSF